MIYRHRDFVRGGGSNFTSAVEEALTGCTNKPEMVTELQTRKEKVLNMTDALCAGKHWTKNLAIRVKEVKRIWQYVCRRMFQYTEKNGFYGSLSHIQKNIFTFHMIVRL